MRILMNEVQSLLKADEAEHSIFSASASDYISEESDLSGKIFGNYKAIKQIGSGGMGSVYLAERIDGVFEQQVALKIVKPGISSFEIISRFEEERQILARLQHPNIARLLDGGLSDSGLPYFTMEFVDGEPITEYCDRKNLTIEERLQLFQKICNAVLYAHQNLVIHRDIKPGNILVREDGIVKLLDFGIAKVFEHDNNRKDLTRTGISVMTPEYASPEQVRGETVSTSTDIYSLGLILYQLLSGCPPYEVNTSSAIELEKIICFSEPLKPSLMISRIQGLTNYRTPADVSRKRQTSVPKLKKRISGDLDNICLMALRKEPERRYNSVAQLVEDVNNHLSGFPVIARKSSRVYHVKKFIQRHKTGVVIGLISVIVIGLVTIFYTVRLANEKNRLQLEAEKFRNVSDFLTGLFKVSDPGQSRGKTITARELLDNGVKRIGIELWGQPEVLANMLGVTGNVYKNLGLYKNALALLSRSYTINDSLFGNNNAESAKSLNDLAALNFAMGEYDSAVERFNEALNIRKNILGEESLESAESMNDLAMVLREQGKYDEAEKLLVQSLSIRKKLSSVKSAEVAESSNNLALLYQDKGEYVKAQKLFEESLQMKEKLYGKMHPSYTETLGNEAFLRQQTGNYQEAGKLFRKELEIDKQLYGDVHPSISTDLYNIASNAVLMGDLDSAKNIYSGVLELDKKLLGVEHPYIALDLNNIAGIESDKGEYEKAEIIYRQSLELNKKVYGNEHPEVATSLSNLGVLYMRWGKYREAEPLLKSALQMRIRLLGENHPDAVTSLNIYASLLTNEGKYKEAVRQYRKSLDLRLKLLGENHPLTANAYLGLGNALIETGDYQEAEEKIKKAIDILKEKLPPDHWNISYNESILGKCYLKEKKYKLAEKLLLKAYKNLFAKRGKEDRVTVSTAKLIIEDYKLMGQPGDARKYEEIIGEQPGKD